MPIRELFHSHFKFTSTSTNPIQKVEDALNFSEELLKQNPHFAQRNPNALNKVQELKNQNPNYLIHEYLNQDWQCFSFQQVVRTLEDIKLSYAGSTDLNVHLDSINFSTEHQEFINAIEHPIFKEQCRDYFANTQFRRDLFIRGKNNLTPLQTQQRLRNTAFMLLISPEKIPKTINGSLGEFNLIQEIYEPIGKLFKQKSYTPLTIKELEKGAGKYKKSGVCQYGQRYGLRARHKGGQLAVLAFGVRVAAHRPRGAQRGHAHRCAQAAVGRTAGELALHLKAQ